MSKPALRVVADGTSYDAWWEIETEAARAQVLVLLQAIIRRQGQKVTERQLAWHLGGVLYRQWGAGRYVLFMDLTGSGKYLALRNLGESDG